MANKEIISQDFIEFHDKKKTIIARGHFDKTTCYIITMVNDLLLSGAISGSGEFTYNEHFENYNTSFLKFNDKKTYDIVKHWINKTNQEYIDERSAYTDSVTALENYTYLSREKFYEKYDELKKLNNKYKNKVIISGKYARIDKE